MSRDLLTGAAALILDWDGTVVDTTVANYRTLAGVLAECQVNLSYDWYFTHSGRSLPDALSLIRAVHPTLPPTDRLIGRCRELRLASVDQLVIVPAVAALLDQARNDGLPCAIASGTTRTLVHAGITALGLTEHFDAIVAAEDVVNGKPAPDLYLTAAVLLGIEPGRCLAVDDAPDGIAAIRAAGMRCLTLQSGHLVAAGEPR